MKEDDVTGEGFTILIGYITFRSCQVRVLHSVGHYNHVRNTAIELELVPLILLTRATVERYKVRSNTQLIKKIIKEHLCYTLSEIRKVRSSI